MVVLTEEQSMKMVVQCLIGFGEKGRNNKGEREREISPSSCDWAERTHYSVQSTTRHFRAKRMIFLTAD